MECEKSLSKFMPGVVVVVAVVDVVVSVSVVSVDIVVVVAFEKNGFMFKLSFLWDREESFQKIV